MEIKNEHGIFSYRRLPEDALNDRRGIVNAGTHFVATKERAVCDYFYSVGYMHLDDVSGLNLDLVREYAVIYHNSRLLADVKRLTS